MLRITLALLLLVMCCECAGAQCRAFGPGFSRSARFDDVFIDDFGRAVFSSRSIRREFVFPATTRAVTFADPAFAFDVFGNVRRIGLVRNVPLVVRDRLFGNAFRFRDRQFFFPVSRFGVARVRRFAPVRNFGRFLIGAPPLTRLAAIRF